MRRHRGYLIHQRDRVISKRQRLLDTIYDVQGDMLFQYVKNRPEELKQHVYKFKGQLSKTNAGSFWQRNAVLKGRNTRWLKKPSILRRLDSAQSQFEDL